MDRQFAAVQKAVAATPSLADVRLVTVTFDPDFDTPAVLAAHAKAVGADRARWPFLTGDADDIAALAKRFGVIAERRRPIPDGGPQPADGCHRPRRTTRDDHVRQRLDGGGPDCRPHRGSRSHALIGSRRRACR